MLRAIRFETPKLLTTPTLNCSISLLLLINDKSKGIVTDCVSHVPVPFKVVKAEENSCIPDPVKYTKRGLLSGPDDWEKTTST